MEALKVICVIVTYNRLELLKESVAAVMQQTNPLHRVVIVDNHSTDGTDNYLAGLSQNPLFHIVTLEKNTGGAGGFSKGIETAARQQADWIWVMDDDTIPKPDSLERLMAYTTFKDVGYVNSKVVWTEGSLHEMNLPLLSSRRRNAEISCRSVHTRAACRRHRKLLGKRHPGRALKKRQGTVLCLQNRQKLLN